MSKFAKLSRTEMKNVLGGTIPPPGGPGGPTEPGGGGGGGGYPCYPSCRSDGMQECMATGVQSRDWCDSYVTYFCLTFCD